MSENDPTYDEWLEGEWKGESLRELAKTDNKMRSYYTNYQDTMAGQTDAQKIKTAAAHKLTWTAPASEEGNGTQPKFERTETPEIPERGGDPEYSGPAYVDWRGEDFTPPGMEFREVPEEERIGNIMAEYYNTKNPLYRQMSEAIVRKFGTRMGTQVQENMILSIGNMVREMAKADQDLYSRNRELYNKGYLTLRAARLNAAAGEAAAHVAGNYQLTATKINDITNQWKAQLASDTQRYGVDVTADVQTYMTDVDKILKGATLLSKIKDNPQAASFLYNMVFGDTEINPEDWAKYWDEKYGDMAMADTGDTETGTTGATAESTRESIKANLVRANDTGNTDWKEQGFDSWDAREASLNSQCNIAANQARVAGEHAYYNKHRGLCDPI